MTVRKVPNEALDFMASLKDIPGEPAAPGSRVRKVPDKLARCADCRQKRDLVLYALVNVCRECAAKRDRDNGLSVQGREWA